MGACFLRLGIFMSLRQGVTPSQFPFSLYSKRKIQCLACRIEKEAVDPMYFRDSTLSLWTLDLFPEGGKPVSVFDFIGSQGRTLIKNHCN